MSLQKTGHSIVVGFNQQVFFRNAGITIANNLALDLKHWPEKLHFLLKSPSGVLNN